jgi:hypothetical protein
MMGLPSNINLSKCKEWADEYLNKNMKGPIGLISFYQPIIANLDLTGRRQLIHCFEYATTQIVYEWLKLAKIGLNIEVGVCKQGYIPECLLNENGEAIPIMVDYLYQSGIEYISAANDQSGFSGSISSSARGLEQRLVVPSCLGENEIILSGLFSDVIEIL